MGEIALYEITTQKLARGAYHLPKHFHTTLYLMRTHDSHFEVLIHGIIDFRRW